MGKVLSPQQAAEIGSSPESIGKYIARRQWLRQHLEPRFNVRVFNQGSLHTPGPLVIFAAHQSNLDPPLLAALSERHLRALFKAEGFKLWPRFFAEGGAIPFDRNDRKQQLQARGETQKILKDNGCLLIFPSGTRDPGQEVKLFRAGAVGFLPVQASYVCVGIAYKKSWHRKKRRTVFYCSDVFTSKSFEDGKNKAEVIKGQLQKVQSLAYAHL